MFNLIGAAIDSIIKNLSLFHTEAPVSADTTKSVDVLSNAANPTRRAANPRTVNFTVSGTVGGCTADRITGGEHDTTESIQELMVRLFRTERGITNAVVTDPADGMRYDCHRNSNKLRIFSEDNQYSTEINL